MYDLCMTTGWAELCKRLWDGDVLQTADQSPEGIVIANIMMIAAGLLVAVASSAVQWTAAALENVSLTISTEMACPADQIVLTCTVFSNSRAFIVGRWGIVGTLTYGFFISDEPLMSDMFEDFAITRSIVPPNYTMISTATLPEAAFSHNNQTIECFGIGIASLTKTISVAGAQDPPTELIFTLSPAKLTWFSPNNNSNCSFNYTVNITDSSSVTEQMNSNSTSLILTDLTRGGTYSFAVAVTDSTGQHGPWSEELRVTWDVPDSIVNYTIQQKRLACFASWKAPLHYGLPILYYIVTHNVTESESVETVNTTDLQIILNRTVVGQSYIITVHAVNIVGAGVNSSGVCEITTDTPVVKTVTAQPMLRSVTVKVSTTGVCSCSCSPTPVAGQVGVEYTVGVAIAALVSGVLSAVGTVIVTSVIVCCVILRGGKRIRNSSKRDKSLSTGVPTDDKCGAHELTPVEYEVPVLKRHKNQNISTQDNIAYGDNILVQQNAAYKQVHIHSHDYY